MEKTGKSKEAYEGDVKAKKSKVSAVSVDSIGGVCVEALASSASDGIAVQQASLAFLPWPSSVLEQSPGNYEA